MIEYRKTVKKNIPYILILCLLVTLCGCASKPTKENNEVTELTDFQTIDSSAAPHEQLLTEANNYLLSARNSYILA